MPVVLTMLSLLGVRLGVLLAKDVVVVVVVVVVVGVTIGLPTCEVLGVLYRET